MTDVSKDKTKRVFHSTDARPFYAPPAPEYTGKIGMEVEMILYQPGTDKPAIPDPQRMQKMQQELRDAGYDAQLEPSGVLEYASPPVEITQVAALSAQMRKDIATFVGKAQDFGFSRAPFSVMPTTTHEDALKNVVARERLHFVLRNLQRLFGPGTLDFSLLGTSVQASFGPKDSGEMFRMTRRGYMMTPLLLAAMNSASGFAGNHPTPRAEHVRGHSYTLTGPAGGIAESFLHAKNGDDFVERHISSVFKTPMHYAFDLDGTPLPPPEDGQVMTFESLIARGLNTQSNYELAESMMYNDIKICNLRDSNGNVVGKRVEVRAADSGIHQPFSTLLLTAAIVPDGPTADAFENLLKDYGFTGGPAADNPLLQASRHAAVHHDGRFMDITFGTGSMRDFAQDVAGLLAGHYEGMKVGPELATLTEVLMTGNCDAKIFAQRYPTLEAVTAELQGPPPRSRPASTPKGPRFGT